jgi:hypothetical protein
MKNPMVYALNENLVIDLHLREPTILIYINNDSYVQPASIEFGCVESVVRIWTFMTSACSPKCLYLDFQTFSICIDVLPFLLSEVHDIARLLVCVDRNICVTESACANCGGGNMIPGCFVTQHHLRIGLRQSRF